MKLAKMHDWQKIYSFTFLHIGYSAKVGTAQCLKLADRIFTNVDCLYSGGANKHM